MIDNKKKVHIGGVYYGLHNIGDEAILYSIINSFSSFDLSISTFGSDWIDKCNNNIEKRKILVDYSKPKMGLFIDPKKRIITNYLKLKKEIDYFKTKDVYICGGATILSDCPWYSLRTVQNAGKAGIPVFLWGIGMAEIYDIATLEYIRKILSENYVKKIFTRDEFVKQRLLEIGIPEIKIGVSYDPAIMIEGIQDYSGKYLTTEQRNMYNNNKPNIVFSLSGENDVVNRTPLNVITEAICGIQKKYDANIFLIPTGCGKHCKDKEFLRLIQKKSGCNRITLINVEMEPEGLVAFLKNVKLIVSSRLHLNILGACAGTPSIGLVRNSKITDFSRLIKMPSLSLDKLYAQQIEDEVSNIINNNNGRRLIQNAVFEMRSQYNKSLDEVCQQISSL